MNNKVRFVYVDDMIGVSSDSAIVGNADVAFSLQQSAVKSEMNN